MQFQILVQRQSEIFFTASVLGLPDCRSTVATEAEAITYVRSELAHRLQKMKVVTVEVETPTEQPPPITGNPWLDSFGIFKDDPTWDEFQANIAEYRREVY